MTFFIMTTVIEKGHNSICKKILILCLYLRCTKAAPHEKLEILLEILLAESVSNLTWPLIFISFRFFPLSPLIWFLISLNILNSIIDS